MKYSLPNLKKAVNLVLDILFTLFVLAPIFGIIVWVIQWWISPRYDFYTSYGSSVLENLEAYETVANICLEYTSQDLTNNPRRSFDISNGELFTYEGEEPVPILLSEREKEFVGTVASKFRIDHSSLWSIIAGENYVSFCAETEPASFIYSPDDIKPNFIRYSGEDKKHSILFRVEKITDHWYFVYD